MIRLVTLTLLALTLPAAAQTATNAPPVFTARFTAVGPTLKPAATVVGEIVRIGDLVDSAGAAANVPIFRAPDLGQTGHVAVNRIVAAVQPHDLADLDTRGLTEVAVTRASHAITGEELRTRVMRALAERQRGANADNLTLAFDSDVRTIHIEPATELRLARLTFDQRSGRFDVLFERPDSKRTLLRYTGTYAETFEAAALTRPLAVGEVVRTADIAVVRRPKTDFGPNVIVNPAQAVGLAAKRAMRPGDLLRQTDLSKPDVVARNDNVTISYQVPGITLTMRGKALEGGSQGELINVLNAQSKRTIQGTVAGPGHVIVTAPVRVNVTSATTAPRLAADATGRPTPQARASTE